ncbi:MULTISPECIES: 16S rRNA (cytosine(967)-C(5))-methyltransferase RsmB [unclassified Francisella]|uniref:16S rRNA (cytosine(967)-C(5))-methyltransferase RsmB n=1 Tax=unclassified Francisella TaxID=2610885 RepID=UPI002E2FB3D0|nr:MULTISPECIES: 16S rRNA (cytosine(967)-C(5))-methyltransferase RsmB [unclassified Francisella]MED7818362.1 16S rRNA (cytosine(967)-C(5))-methyltransferase RsmB [Francisella sp. 19S2-4]MED7829198.1 16S rRNA (cytosine(967)-C(5))-methyltransferase RsmB [Francisella sp. 19S2-10]
MNTRAIVAKVILDILDKKYSLLTIEHKLANLQISDQDKSFIKLLCYEFFRNYFSLEKILNIYISDKTKQKVKILIMLGVLQIFEINQPHYASINETVSACKNLKIIWAKKLVNGVLRKILRNIESLTKEYNNYKKFDMPEWLSNILKQQYPDNYKDIIEASNSKADMFIRLNCSSNNNKVLDYFTKNNIDYEIQNEIKNCIKLKRPISVEKNNLFQKGYFTVQDLSAQYAGWIINPQNEDKILDACAAPGGKTSHILELAPKADITAIDILDRRLALLKESLNRISHNNNVNIIKQDLTKTFTGKFNKIILDAPCSALGTIKRNPDIKVLRELNDINEITKVQAQILQNIWNNNLEDSGLLLYVTCSILKQENQNQIKTFLAQNNDASVIDINILEKYKTDCGYQILPCIEKGDGFYYCLLKKTSS